MHPAVGHRGLTRHRAAAVALGVGSLVALAGCDIRLDTPDPEVTPAPAAEQSRQDAALRAHELSLLAEAALGSGPSFEVDVADVLGQVASASAIHREATGGIWEPWPGAGPLATVHPSSGEDDTGEPEATAVPDDVTVADVLTALEDGALDAHDSVLDEAADRRLLLASIAVSRQLLAVELRAVADVPSTVTGEVAEDELWSPETLGGMLDAQAADAFDAGRFVYELIAARTEGDERASALERAQQLESIALAAGARHEPSRDLTSAGGTDAGAAELAAGAEADVTVALLALLARDVAHEDIPVLLAAAVDAAVRAQSLGFDFPALPGVAPTS